MPEKIFAALVVASCVVLLVRLLMGERKRAVVARAWRRMTAGLALDGLLARWRAPVAQRRAKKEAEAAIRRARARAGQWDGNVYRPSSFGERRKREPTRRDLH